MVYLSVERWGPCDLVVGLDEQGSSFSVVNPLYGGQVSVGHQCPLLHHSVGGVVDTGRDFPTQQVIGHMEGP